MMAGGIRGGRVGGNMLKDTGAISYKTKINAGEDPGGECWEGIRRENLVQVLIGC